MQNVSDFSLQDPVFKGEFKVSIERILKLICISESNIRLFTSSKHLQTFYKAFVSSEVEPNNSYNYEILEKIGDTLVNSVITTYVVSAFPDTRSIHLISTTSNRLKSNENLYTWLVSLKLDKFVRISESITKNDNKWIKIHANVFEALIYAMYSVVSSEKLEGTGYLAVRLLVYSLLEKESLDITQAALDDKKSILQQKIYDKMFPKWGNAVFTDILIPKGPNTGKHYSKVFGYFPANEPRKMVIGKGIGETETKAKKAAAGDAIKFLIGNGIVSINTRTGFVKILQNYGPGKGTFKALLDLRYEISKDIQPVLVTGYPPTVESLMMSVRKLGNEQAFPITVTTDEGRLGTFIFNLTVRAASTEGTFPGLPERFDILCLSGDESYSANRLLDQLQKKFFVGAVDGDKLAQGMKPETVMSKNGIYSPELNIYVFKNTDPNSILNLFVGILRNYFRYPTLKLTK